VRVVRFAHASLSRCGTATTRVFLVLFPRSGLFSPLCLQSPVGPGLLNAAISFSVGLTPTAFFPLSPPIPHCSATSPWSLHGSQTVSRSSNILFVGDGILLLDHFFPPSPRSMIIYSFIFFPIFRLPPIKRTSFPFRFLGAPPGLEIQFD